MNLRPAAGDRSEADKAERDRARLGRKVGLLVIEKDFLEKSASSSGAI